MKEDSITYRGKNIGEAKAIARNDNQELKNRGSDARLLISTMKWDRRGTRGGNKNRYYSVKYIGDL